MAARKSKTVRRTDKPAKDTVRSTDKPAKDTVRGMDKPAKDTVNNKRSKKPSNHNSEIFAICSIAMSILLGIGIYTDSDGLAGNFVDIVFKGLFGFGALFIPLACAWIGVSMIIRKFEYPRVKNVGLVIGLFLCICSMAYVISGVDYSPQSRSVAAIAFSEGSVKNGGLFGALLGNFLLYLPLNFPYVTIFSDLLE